MFCCAFIGKMIGFIDSRSTYFNCEHEEAIFNQSQCQLIQLKMYGDWGVLVQKICDDVIGCSELKATAAHSKTRCKISWSQ